MTNIKCNILILLGGQCWNRTSDLLIKRRVLTDILCTRKAAESKTLIRARFHFFIKSCFFIHFFSTFLSRFYFYLPKELKNKIVSLFWKLSLVSGKYPESRDNVLKPYTFY